MENSPLRNADNCRLVKKFPIFYGTRTIHCHVHEISHRFHQEFQNAGWGPHASVAGLCCLSCKLPALSNAQVVDMRTRLLHEAFGNVCKIKEARVWRTCDTRAQNDTLKDFLGTRLSQCFFFYFLCPTSFSVLKNMCIYNHTSVYRLYINYRYYQKTIQCNIFTQIGAVRSFDWIFIIGAPTWRWLDQYVALGRTFYSILL